MDARPYHHGDLRQALLAAAERALARDGERLSLRAIAREVGVSHAAPAHHFGDLRGLLTALATAGFERFGAALRDAARDGSLPALGRAYVRFALDAPALFLLMFRSAALDAADPALVAARRAAFGTLAGVAAGTPGPPAADGEGAIAAAVPPWCLAHGLALLLLDRQFPPGLGDDALIDAVFGPAPGAGALDARPSN